MFENVLSKLKTKLTIEEACGIFRKRFGRSGINKYHVLKSLGFFDDAESEPEPNLLMEGKDWEWVSVKSYFEDNIKKFEKGLLL